MCETEGSSCKFRAGIERGDMQTIYAWPRKDPSDELRSNRFQPVQVSRPVVCFRPSYALYSYFQSFDGTETNGRRRKLRSESSLESTWFNTCSIFVCVLNY